MGKKRVGAAKGSRNKKKYWRKGTDVAHLEEEYLQHKDQQRIFGSLNEKSDDQLFVIEKTPTQLVLPNARTKASGGSRKSLQDDLKCFTNLKTNTLIPPAKTVGVKTFPQHKSKLERRLRGITADKTKPIRDIRKQNDLKETEFFNLWSSDASISKAKKITDDVCGEIEDYYLRATKKRLPNMPNTKKVVTTVLSKVETPHPGASYNPSFEDHLDLLEVVWDDERKKLERERELERKLRIPATESYATQESLKKELNAGLNETDEELKSEPRSEGEEDEQTKGYVPLPQPVSSENRKSQKQRRQQLGLKKERQKREKVKIAKQQMHEVYRVKKLKSELDAESKLRAERIQRRSERKKAKLAKPANLSSYKYEGPEDEFQLTQELAGSMRLLKPAGCVMVDRFKSLQRRNIIEVRPRQGRRKQLRRKEYETRSYKSVTEHSLPK